MDHIFSIKKIHDFKMWAWSNIEPYSSHQNAKNTIFSWQFGTAPEFTHASSDEKVKSGT